MKTILATRLRQFIVRLAVLVAVMYTLGLLFAVIGGTA